MVTGVGPPEEVVAIAGEGKRGGETAATKKGGMRKREKDLLTGEGEGGTSLRWFVLASSLAPSVPFLPLSLPLCACVRTALHLSPGLLGLFSSALSSSSFSSSQSVFREASVAVLPHTALAVEGGKEGRSGRRVEQSDECLVSAAGSDIKLSPAGTASPTFTQTPRKSQNAKRQLFLPLHPLPPL